MLQVRVHMPQMKDPARDSKDQRSRVMQLIPVQPNEQIVKGKKKKKNEQLGEPAWREWSGKLSLRKWHGDQALWNGKMVDLIWRLIFRVSLAGQGSGEEKEKKKASQSGHPQTLLDIHAQSFFFFCVLPSQQWAMTLAQRKV